MSVSRMGQVRLVIDEPQPTGGEQEAYHLWAKDHEKAAVRVTREGGRISHLCRARCTLSAAPQAKLDAAMLRLGLSDEPKLEKLLSIGLVNIIKFLGSEHAAVRAKAIEVLTHISKRVKDSRTALPLDKLVELFGVAASPFELNFALMYTDLALARATPAERSTALPHLLRRASERAPPLRAVALALFAQHAADVHLEPRERFAFLARKGTAPAADGAAVAASAPFEGLSADGVSVAAHWLDVLLFAPSSTSMPCSPGLSIGAHAALVPKLGGADYAALGARKLALLKLANALLPTSHRLPLLVVGASDGSQRVAEFADNELRRLGKPEGSADSTELVVALCALVSGHPAARAAAAALAPLDPPARAARNVTLSAELRVPDASALRLPASMPAQVRALGLLARSDAAAEALEHVGRVVALCAEPAAADGVQVGAARRHAAAVQLALWTFKQASEEAIERVAPQMLGSLRRALHAAAEHCAFDDGGGGVSAAGGETVGEAESVAVVSAESVPLTFMAVGELARRAPKLFAGDVDSARALFSALSTRELDARMAAQEALACLATAFAAAGGGTLAALEGEQR
ncbi:proteasome stabiliser ECM29 [Pavlovales sp. CCMP2436]|nr:proteasome stabiliser ECM29 [Pavlovales sp. CCMP2436]